MRIPSCSISAFPKKKNRIIVSSAVITDPGCGSMKNEFKLLSKIIATYLPPEYPYDVVGGARLIKQLDFDDRIDILPVADPNIFSM